MRTAAVILAWAVVSAAAQTRAIPGDSDRGAEVFRTQNCFECHGAHGTRNLPGPDLTRWTGRSFTPASLATYLWNHAPTMWSAMDKAGIARPNLSRQQASDLFAYFSAFRYFERPGEAGRGKRVFSSGRCATCHGVRGSSPNPAARPIAEWANVSDPIVFAGSMWNHSARMRDEMRKRKLDWPDLNAQQLTDLLVYARNLPGGTRATPQVRAGDATEGERVFRSKGCAGCHQGKLSLDQARHRTLSEFAVAMWNHAPRMKEDPPQLEAAEMRSLVSYLWSVSYFDDPGDARRGAKVYAAKQCDSCHAKATWMAPSLSRLSQPLDPIDFVSNVWRHGPSMQEWMKQNKVAWPKFEDSDLSDLIAYLNSRRD